MSTTTSFPQAFSSLIQREVKAKINPTASFPCMLHQCLSDIEELCKRDPAMHKLNEIVSWQKQGAAFRVHDKKRFEDLIMPVWFIRLKYSSFIRQLSLFGFKKIHKDTKDAQKGAMYHSLFLQGRPDLAHGIHKMGKNKPQYPQLQLMQQFQLQQQRQQQRQQQQKACATPKLCQPLCLPPCPQALPEQQQQEKSLKLDNNNCLSNSLSFLQRAVPAARQQMHHLQGNARFVLQGSATSNTGTRGVNGLVNLLSENIFATFKSVEDDLEEMPEIDTSNLVMHQHTQADADADADADDNIHANCDSATNGNPLVSLVLQNMDLSFPLPGANDCHSDQTAQQDDHELLLLSDLLEPTPLPPLASSSSAASSNNHHQHNASYSAVMDQLLEAQGVTCTFDAHKNQGTTTKTQQTQGWNNTIASDMDQLLAFAPLEMDTGSAGW